MRRLVVLGSDDRTQVTSAAYPWRTTLFSLFEDDGSLYRCTATMISPLSLNKFELYFVETTDIQTYKHFVHWISHHQNHHHTLISTEYIQQYPTVTSQFFVVRNIFMYS